MNDIEGSVQRVVKCKQTRSLVMSNPSVLFMPPTRTLAAAVPVAVATTPPSVNSFGDESKESEETDSREQQEVENRLHSFPIFLPISAETMAKNARTYSLLTGSTAHVIGQGEVSPPFISSSGTETLHHVETPRFVYVDKQPYRWRWSGPNHVSILLMETERKDTVSSSPTLGINMTDDSNTVHDSSNWKNIQIDKTHQSSRKYAVEFIYRGKLVPFARNMRYNGLPVSSIEVQAQRAQNKLLDIEERVRSAKSEAEKMQWISEWNLVVEGFVQDSVRMPGPARTLVTYHPPCFSLQPGFK